MASEMLLFFGHRHMTLLVFLLISKTNASDLIQIHSRGNGLPRCHATYVRDRSVVVVLTTSSFCDGSKIHWIREWSNKSTRQSPRHDRNRPFNEEADYLKRKVSSSSQAFLAISQAFLARTLPARPKPKEFPCVESVVPVRKSQCEMVA
jgi:hypothetical protein